jgi:hypothetical protein
VLVENPRFDSKRNLVFDIFSRNLADFVESQVVWDPIQLVIIGGNISLSHQLFLAHTTDLLKKCGIEVEI